VGQATVTLVCVFLLAEATARVVDLVAHRIPLGAADEDSVLYHEHPYLYKLPTPEAEFDVYRVNRHGFRGADFEMPKPAGVFRLLTLGDSSTWDSNVSSNEATWSAQLERLLNEGRPAGGPRFEVVNGGVPGFTSAESLMNLVWRGLPVQPDAVLVYQAYTDFKPNRMGTLAPDYSNFRGRDRSLFRALSEKSRLLCHLRSFVTRRAPVTDRAHDDVLPPGIAVFRTNLRRLVLLARDAGAQPLLATFAMPLTPENEREHHGKFRGLRRNLSSLSFAGVQAAHRKYNAAIVDLGREMGVPVLDVDRALPKDFEHFTDHCHLSDQGSLRMATFLAAELPAVLAPLPAGLEAAGPAGPP
jgi:hypothetical protein